MFHTPGIVCSSSDVCVLLLSDLNVRGSFVQYMSVESRIIVFIFLEECSINNIYITDLCISQGHRRGHQVISAVIQIMNMSSIQTKAERLDPWVLVSN